MAKNFPVPGLDDYQQMIRLLGQPGLIQATPDGHNYIYPNVIVNVSGEDQFTITSISFSRPHISIAYIRVWTWG